MVSFPKPKAWCHHEKIQDKPKLNTNSIKYQGREKKENTGAVTDKQTLRRCDNKMPREILDAALGQKKDMGGKLGKSE